MNQQGGASLRVARNSLNFWASKQQLQKKVWDLGILQLEDYDLEVIFLFPGESDAGASCSPFQIPSSMLDQA